MRTVIIRFIACASICIMISGCGQGTFDIQIAGHPLEDAVIFTSPSISQNDLYWYDPSDGLVALIKSKHYERTPSFSPDGKMIALSRSRKNPGPAHLWLLDIDSGELTQLTNGNYYDFFPRFSSDGKRLIFVRGSRMRDYSMGGKTWVDYDVFEMGIDGDDMRQITQDKYGTAYAPNYLDDDHIIYSIDTARRSEIYIAPLDGSRRPELLTRGSYSEYNTLKRKLAFVSDKEVQAYNYEIWVRDIDTSEEARLTDEQSYISSPTFAALGSKLYYLSEPERSGLPELHMIDMVTLESRNVSGPDLFRGARSAPLKSY